MIINQGKRKPRKMRRGPRAVLSGTPTFEDKMKENREQPKRNNEN